MGASLFHVSTERLINTSAGEYITLDGDEGYHAATVQRMHVGESVLLADGEGRLAHGTVVEVPAKDQVLIEVVAITVAPPPQPRVLVVQALPKGDRGELAVEMLTEVGVDVIIPWAAQRCVAQWKGDKEDKGVAKWRTAAREAAKQSRRPRTPQITNLASTKDVIRLISETPHAWVLHEDGDIRLSGISVPIQGDLLLVVGPEGGVSSEELEAFSNAGAQVVRLGPTVLRTSTAGTVAAGIVMSRTTRWA
ncbi:MAG: Ribosomal small subunit methyltransferase [Actinomycetota bacterium]|jgi:16S rRNA (uracil1498-N3)-methyltransferase